MMINESTKQVMFDNLRIKRREASLMQWTHYYPYGLPIERMSSMYYYNREPENRLLMTCKEWNDEQGLNEYDFGARSYDPATIRWYVMDPAEQFHNPYFAIGGNPVVGVDPDGRMTIFGSMGIGALFGGLGYLMQGNISFEGFAKATLQGAVSGAVSFGVGVGFGEVSSNLTHELGRAFSHSVNQNLVGAAFGQKVTAGSLLSSGLGSLAGSGMEAGKFGVAEKMMGSMMVGGITSHLGGGNFWQGAMMSGLVEATNHLQHGGDGQEERKKKTQEKGAEPPPGYKYEYIPIDERAYNDPNFNKEGYKKYYNPDGHFPNRKGYWALRTLVPDYSNSPKETIKIRNKSSNAGMDTSTWINIYRYPETLKHMAHPVPDIKIPKITPKQ